MFVIIVFFSGIDSASDDQLIGPFLTERDATEWGTQIIGDPEGLPWQVQELDSPTSCVKQFRVEGLDD